VASAFTTALDDHLRKFASAPVLFVGAGFSRRYLGLDNWEGLLRRFAAVASQSYEFYAASASGDPVKTASLIAADLHPTWWKDDAFAETREMYAGKLKTPDSALKAEVARYIAAGSTQRVETDLTNEELSLLPKVVVDSLITTNYDSLLEQIFPAYEVFVGQDQLLFSEPLGVGEIYKIHGSHEDPDSLVLTSSDYARFEERNPYLAAKLLTIFVEHPVLFVGYSMGDENVGRILRSIAKVLTTERIQELQDRLLFVDWKPETEAAMAPSTFMLDEDAIPAHTLTVPDYRELLQVLGGLDRRLPAPVLRRAKEHVYELVRTNDPQGRLYVQDLEADADAAEVDVVLGIGKIQELAEDYRGKTRTDLLPDALDPAQTLNPLLVVQQALPKIPVKARVPIYKYLRAAGLLTDDGQLIDGADVDEKVRARVLQGPKAFQPPNDYAARAQAAADAAGDFAGLVEAQNEGMVLMFLAKLDEGKIPPEELREFLLAHQESQFENGHALQAAQWAKGVCIYDWLVHGRANGH
jgi:hypothetical protein